MRYLIVLLLFIPLAGFSQQSVELGDVYFDFFQYREAIREYEKALASERNAKNEVHILTQLAYCYTYTFQYEKAEARYSELVRLGDKKQDPDVYLEYANILKILGKYSQARDQINYYVSQMKSDEYTNMLLRSLSWAETHRDSVRKRTYVQLTNIDVAGQSLGYDYFMDGLIYSKAKDTAYSEYTTLFDLDFLQMKDSVTFIKGEDYLSEIKFPFNEGSPSVSHDGEIIYFTATAIKVKKGVVRRVGTTQVSEDGVSNLKIYSARFENGRFAYIRELPFNNKEYNCTHPCIYDRGNTLYFASDMPGGYGGLDLYKVVKQPDGSWSAPINLGNKINTSENEMYPYMRDGYLYFASKGHVGFGGYDLFQCSVTGNTLSVPRNMGKPFNSSRDDVAFIISGDGYTGYFSSNRDNPNGYDRVYYFNDRTEAQKPALPVLAASEAPGKPQSPAPDLPPARPSPANEGKPAAARVANGAVVSTVLFGFDLNRVEASYHASLDSAVALARVNKKIRFNIHAHTDCRGSDAYNMALARRRAQSVRAYLISKGVPADRIGMISYGESRPVITCEPCGTCSEEQHSVNRRVEVKVVVN